MLHGNTKGEHNYTLNYNIKNWKVYYFKQGEEKSRMRFQTEIFLYPARNFNQFFCQKLFCCHLGQKYDQT